MAVAKIEVMDSEKLLVIAFLAIGIQIAFFIIPSCYIPNSVDIVTLTANKYPNNIYHKYSASMYGVENRYKSRASSYQPMNKKPCFVFRLPCIRNSSLPIEHSKWHSKTTGFLTVFKYDMIDQSVYTKWDVSLLAFGDQHRFYKYESSFLEVHLNKPFSEDYPAYYSSNYDNGISKYSEIITLLEFEPTLYDEYTLTIESETIKRHEFQALQMSLTLTIPNAAFSKFMVYLKTIFFALAMLFTIWCRLRFYKHVEVFNNREKATFTLGIALLCLDIPVEWFTLIGPSDFLLYTKDVRTDIYYAALTACCPIFIGECIVPNTSTGLRIEKQYSMSKIVAISSCCAWTILHAIQNYMDVNYPFSNLTYFRISYILLLFVIPMIMVALIYTIYLANMIRKTLSKKAEISGPPSAASHRRSLRSVFPLMSTLICVLFTFIELVTCEVLRYQTTWSTGPRQIKEEPVALSIGVFAMWNIYTWMMMYLHAPERYAEPAPTQTAPIPTATITTTTLPPPELMEPPSYDEYLRSITAAGGSKEAKNSNDGEENIC